MIGDKKTNHKGRKERRKGMRKEGAERKKEKERGGKREKIGESRIK